MSTGDPLEHWTNETDTRPVSLDGTLVFSCCGRSQTLTGVAFSQVQCRTCHTLYSLTLQVSLISPDEYKFSPGVRVRVRESLSVVAGASPLTLSPTETYLTTQDIHGVLNVPPGHQPILVTVPGDRGPRVLVAIIPADLLEPAD